MADFKYIDLVPKVLQCVYIKYICVHVFVVHLALNTFLSNTF